LYKILARLTIACLLVCSTIQRLSAQEAFQPTATYKNILATNNDSLRTEMLLSYQKGVRTKDSKQGVALGLLILEDAIRRKDKRLEMRSYEAIADAFHVAYDFPKAAEYYMKMREAAGQVPDYTEQVNSNMLLANVYDEMKQQEVVVTALYENALKICHEHTLVKSEPIVLSNMAIFYAVQGNLEKSISLSREALVLVRKNGDKVNEISTLVNLAEALAEHKNYDEAIGYYSIADRIADSLHLDYSKAAIANSKAWLYFYQEKYSLSEQYAKEAVVLAQSFNDRAFELSMYDLLRQLYHKQGKNDDAYSYFARWTTLRDSVFTQEKSAQIDELQTKYDTKLKDQQISSQQNQLSFNKKTNVFYLIAIGFLVITGGGIFFSYRRAQNLNKKIRIQQTELIAQKLELQKLNAVKDRLFSTISHDMRRPVNSLLSFTTLLDGGNMPPEKLAIYAAELKTTLSFTASLMENLLNFARSQMQGYHPNLEKISLTTVTIEALEIAAPAAHQKSITLINEVNNKDGVIADIDMLGLIIRNLLGNAIKFTNKGGSIVLSSAVMPDGTVCWQVQDNGTGIETSLVNAFNQHKDNSEQPLESTLGTDKEKGTGLGLMLSKTFLALMGGHITLQSEKGKGSTFRVYLPSAKSDSAV
jgi:signal transduction histidine kinase